MAWVLWRRAKGRPELWPAPAQPAAVAQRPGHRHPDAGRRHGPHGQCRAAHRLGAIAAFIAVVPMLVCGWGSCSASVPAGWNSPAWWWASPACCCWCAAPVSRPLRLGPGLHRRCDAWPGRWAPCSPPRRPPLAPGAIGIRQRNVVRRRGVDGVSVALGEQSGWPAAAGGRRGLALPGRVRLADRVQQPTCICWRMQAPPPRRATLS